MPHITGLDPANPCKNLDKSFEKHLYDKKMKIKSQIHKKMFIQGFGQGEELSGLIRGDADFVDVIHTNPGVLGKRDPIGNLLE